MTDSTHEKTETSLIETSLTETDLTEIGTDEISTPSTLSETEVTAKTLTKGRIVRREIEGPGVALDLLGIGLEVEVSMRNLNESRMT